MNCLQILTYVSQIDFIHLLMSMYVPERHMGREKPELCVSIKEIKIAVNAQTFLFQLLRRLNVSSDKGDILEHAIIVITKW